MQQCPGGGGYEPAGAEKYTPSEDRGCLEVEVRLIVPDAGLNMRLIRTYDRTEHGGPI